MKPTYVRCGKVIDDVRSLAREHGYAVAVHGSLRAERDIDLIAAPWIKRAHSPRTLMRAISKLPYLMRVKSHDHDPPKPHGRLGYVWIIRYRAKGCPAFVDLSVIPRLTVREPDGTQGIAGASRSSQGMLDGDAPVPRTVSREGKFSA